MDKPGKCVKFIIRVGPPKWGKWGYLFSNFKMSVETPRELESREDGRVQFCSPSCEKPLLIICIS